MSEPNPIEMLAMLRGQAEVNRMKTVTSLTSVLGLMIVSLWPGLLIVTYAAIWRWLQG